MHARSSAAPVIGVCTPIVKGGGTAARRATGARWALGFVFAAVDSAQDTVLDREPWRRVAVMEDDLEPAEAEAEASRELDE